MTRVTKRDTLRGMQRSPLNSFRIRRPRTVLVITDAFVAAAVHLSSLRTVSSEKSSEMQWAAISVSVVWRFVQQNQKCSRGAGRRRRWSYSTALLPGYALPSK